MNSMLLPFLLSSVAATPAAAPQPMDAVVSTAGPADQAVPDEVPIGRDAGDRMTVEVKVGGKGPYRFLVDTGSERTVISRELAGKLALEAGEAVTLHSVVGATGVNTVMIPDLKVSGNNVSVVDAPALQAEHIGADGMLGVDSLHSRRVLFDFKAKTMSITPSTRYRPRPNKDEIVVQAKSRRGRLIFTDARIQGQKVSVIVDTGSQVTIGNLALKRALAKRHANGLTLPVTIYSVTGEALKADVTKISRLNLNGLDLNDLGVAFLDAHIFDQLDLKGKPAILLGMNAMRAFDRISIDFADKKVRFILPGTSMRDSIKLASRE